MDTDLLREIKLKPVAVGPAALHEYRLRIGNRATLAPNAGSISYGMLIELSDDDLSILYSSPSVSDYQPQIVETVRLSDGITQSALCYNLPVDQLGAEFNSEYAKNLSALLVKLGFPNDYVLEVNQPDV
jgi:hypothetical protein